MEPLLQTIELKKYFSTKRGMLHAVDDISITINKGETLGIVGESGCGKSTLGRVILRLLEPTGGKVLFEGKNTTDYSKSELHKMHRDIQMIFQDPYSSLNPRKSIGDIIREPLVVNKILTSKKDIDDRVRQLLDTVGLSQNMINVYPHELDGGRRQRVGIARAFAMEPKLIVCDEPVSALDVSIQAQILNLLMDLQDDMGLSYMFITHDLSVVKHISNNIAVLYMGQCVEMAPSDELFNNPMHPYTKALLSAIPVPDVEIMRNRKRTIRGEVTSPIEPKPGCRFAPRCEQAHDGCIGKNFELKERGESHYVACYLYDEES